MQNYDLESKKFLEVYFNFINPLIVSNRKKQNENLKKINWKLKFMDLKKI